MQHKQLSRFILTISMNVIIQVQQWQLNT